MIFTSKKSDESKNEDNDSKINYIVIPASSNESDEPKLRIIGLIGDINEEKTTEVLYGMLSLYESGIKQEPIDPEDEDCEEFTTIYDPFEIILCTPGGNASEMFAIYDLIRHMRETCDICTTGMGKVMSAGVLLLAAGTKGKRKIGAHCRVMIHSVIGGTHGTVHNLENEMEEIHYVQQQYIKALVKETAMSKKYITNLLNKKVNIYISAQEAVELGIVDEVI